MLGAVHTWGVNDGSVDADPVWTASRSFDPDTAEARAFCNELNIEIARTAPYSQAGAVAENVQRPLLALTNVQLVHATLAPTFWQLSMSNAADVLNRLPKPGSTRPALTSDKSPHEGMFGIAPDISRLAAAFGCLTYVKIDGAKPSQLRDTARMGLYMGVATGGAGWKVYMTDTGSMITSAHITIDHDLQRRPAMLLESDALRLPTDGDARTAAVSHMRTLLNGRSPGGILVLDPLTGQPARVVEVHNAYGTGENHLTIEPTPDAATGGHRKPLRPQTPRRLPTPRRPPRRLAAPAPPRHKTTCSLARSLRTDGPILRSTG